jgi:hypothetical protein
MDGLDAGLAAKAIDRSLLTSGDAGDLRCSAPCIALLHIERGRLHEKSAAHPIRKCQRRAVRLPGLPIRQDSARSLSPSDPQWL